MCGYPSPIRNAFSCSSRHTWSGYQRTNTQGVVPSLSSLKGEIAAPSPRQIAKQTGGDPLHMDNLQACKLMRPRIKMKLKGRHSFPEMVRKNWDIQTVELTDRAKVWCFLSQPFPRTLPPIKEFKATFTRQTKVGKLVLANSSWCAWKTTTVDRHVGKLLARIETSSICRQQFANMFGNCCCVFHTRQLEFAKTRLPTLNCRVKAVWETTMQTAKTTPQNNHIVG